MGMLHFNLLTTEQLRKKFKNNFTLCNFAIQIGRNMIASGNQISLAEVLQAVNEKSEEDIKEIEQK